MNRSRLAPLLLAALLLSAGCAGILPGTDTADSGPVGESYPAGVTASGVNATAATDAHRAALNGSSFTASVTIDQRVDNRSQTVSAVQRVGPEHEVVWSEVDMETGTRTVYLSEDTQYVRGTSGNQTRYDARQRTGASDRLLLVSPTATDLVNWTLVNGNFTVTGTEERNGSTLTTLEASSLAANATKPSTGTLTGFNATVVVDERGVVRSLSYAVDLSRDGQNYSTSISMNVSDVGSTDVSEPAWLDEAKNQSSATTAA